MPDPLDEGAVAPPLGEADLQMRRERWGISYYVIFERDMDTFAPVVARLAGT